MTDTTTPTAETGTRRELGLDGDWRAALRAPLVLALAAALVVQLALALMLGGGHSMAPAAQDEPLLDLDLDKVAELDIASGDGASLVLRRSGDAWVLPGLGDFPASDTRVQSLLDDLDGLKRPLPEATSADAQRRFKVADDNFERRLTLRGGGKQATLFVGDSPGFRRTFARVDGEDAVYDLRLGLFDLSDKADDWIDRGQLQIDRGKITGIAAADADGGPAGKWALTRGEEGWSLAGSDGKVDGAATDALVDAVATVSYSGVLAPDSDAKYDLDAPKRVLTVDYDGKQRRYLLAPIGDSGDYALKRDGSPYVYRIGAFDAETLVGTDQDKLLGKKKPEAGAGDEGAAGAVGEAPAPAASAEAAKEMEPGPAADATPTQEARPPQQRP
ncbi:MAG: DUF4340 domain-containing protein [Thiohalocapsa sp.]|jgi:hypothetical protein|uniref:DUF4340 domain-containing protein n=1 Tax=Thiohalocapsa sp. TaxID=2497641 RepID=UPI0025D86CD4|nr:DUF4340 domain-containing protein [Thiohalocapsa sp.]MCG6941603.1 DUF4340 domain-containing protein [Thiohalocapsa sp.]